MPFEKGKSGNPGGRPKVVAEVRELARQHTETAVGALVEILNSKEAQPAARVAAANAILDRGYGKPAQTHEGGEKPFEHIHKVVSEIVDPKHGSG